MERNPGLVQKCKISHVAQNMSVQNITDSVSATSKEAEKSLIHQCEEIEQKSKPDQTFRDAIAKYFATNQHKATIYENPKNIQILNKYIGDLPLSAINMESLEKYIEEQKKEGVGNRSINYGLQFIRRIINLATDKRCDDDKEPCLTSVPTIQLLPETPKKKRHSLSSEEQQRLLNELPKLLREIALFAVNTGCRQAEICQLQWQWEVQIPALNTSIFVIPGNVCMNGCGRVIILNQIARSVIDAYRDQHPTYVFCYRGEPLAHLLNSTWKKARAQADLKEVGIYDLRYTYEQRLKTVGVSDEYIEELLGRKSISAINYASEEINQLLIAAEKICEFDQYRLPSLVS